VAECCETGVAFCMWWNNPRIIIKVINEEMTKEQCKFKKCEKLWDTYFKFLKFINSISFLIISALITLIIIILTFFHLMQKIKHLTQCLDRRFISSESVLVQLSSSTNIQFEKTRIWMRDWESYFYILCTLLSFSSEMEKYIRNGKKRATNGHESFEFLPFWRWKIFTEDPYCLAISLWNSLMLSVPIYVSLFSATRIASETDPLQITNVPNLASFCMFYFIIM